MENSAQNQVTAIRTTITFCNLPASVTATTGITAFAPTLTTAKNKLVLIDNYNIIAEGSTKGVTLDTTAIRATVESITFKCSSAVIAFASQVPVNNSLIAAVNFSQSKLKKASKASLIAIAQATKTAAGSNAAILNFGIIASDITDLASAITLFTTDSSDPRQAIINKNDAKLQIKILIKSVNQNVFKMQMDRMINTLLIGNSEFVGKYFKAREIINLGLTHTKVKGIVTKADGTAIPFPTLKLMKTGTTVVDYLIEGDVNGILPNTYVKPDDYDMLAEARGFISQTEIRIHFAVGKTITRKYKLLPI
jgi:hypothetical protein